jgi:hypothetical protein
MDEYEEFHITASEAESKATTELHHRAGIRLREDVVHEIGCPSTSSPFIEMTSIVRPVSSGKISDPVELSQAHSEVSVRIESIGPSPGTGA